MTFREMLVEDLDQVMEIENDLISPPWTREGFFTFLLKDENMFFVVEEKGQILGYCSMQTVLDEANKAGIPVFGSEVEQVKAGCVASMGLEYIELGKQTGKMAAKVLKGEAKASELNFEVISEPSLYVNFAAAEKIGLELPENYKTDAYQSFDEIVVQ